MALSSLKLPAAGAMLGVAALAIGAFSHTGCQAPGRPDPSGLKASGLAAPTAALSMGEVRELPFHHSEAFPAAEFEQGRGWSSGRCRIDTPLPEAWPAPTPPGRLAWKRYPLTRLASVSGSVWPDLGSSLSFMTLFRHIRARDLPMTSPVQMTYHGLERESPDLESWEMAFLYPTAADGAPGDDGSVTVADQPGCLVLAMGFRGGYGIHLAEEAGPVLMKIAAQVPTCRPAGPLRVLHYNGPDVPSAWRWAEVQLPVQFDVAPVDAMGAAP